MSTDPLRRREQGTLVLGIQGSPRKHWYERLDEDTLESNYRVLLASDRPRGKPSR